MCVYIHVSIFFTLLPVLCTHGQTGCTDTSEASPKQLLLAARQAQAVSNYRHVYACRQQGRNKKEVILKGSQ